MKNCEKKANKSKALLRFFLYAASGVLCALPIALPSLWLLGWIAPAPCLYFELIYKREKDSLARAYLRGASFFWPFGVCTFHWFIKLYPLDFLGFEKGEALCVVLLATLGIPLLQCAVSSLSFVIIHLARKHSPLSGHPVFLALLSGALFSLFEYLHTLTWAGVPWGRMAIGQTGALPVIQSASLFGSYFITFIMVFSAALLAFAFSALLRKSKGRAAALSILCLCVFSLNLLFGAVKMSLPEKGETVTVGAVQGNIRFEDKWAGKASFTIDTYLSLTRSCAEEGASLVIWPETALPYDMTENPEIYDYFSYVSSECGAECLVTVFESEGDDTYNTVRLASPDGSIGDTVYKKRHLVPFGEYVPFEELISRAIPPLAELCSMMDQLSPGDGTEIIETDSGSVGCLICFDSIYEELCRESVCDGAELICISTNDSWFTESAALSQHNAQARLRAIENGRFVVRAANTGISSVIDPCGRVLTSLGDSERGYITEDVRFISDTTLYSKTGNLFVYLCAAFSFAALISSFFKKKRDNK